MVQKSDATTEGDRQAAPSSGESALAVDLRDRSANDAYARMTQVRELPGGFPKSMEIGSAATTMLADQIPALDKSTMNKPTIYTYRFDNVSVDVVQSKLSDGGMANRQETPSRDGSQRTVTLTYSKPQQLTLGKDDKRISIENVSSMNVHSNKDGSYQIRALHFDRNVGLPIYRHFDVKADGTVTERIPTANANRTPVSGGVRG